MSLHTVPRPLAPVLLIPHQKVLSWTPRIETERDASQPRSRRHAARLRRRDVSKRLTRVVPDPQRIPEGVGDGFGVESEVGHIGEGGEFAPDLRGKRLV